MLGQLHIAQMSSLQPATSQKHMSVPHVDDLVLSNRFGGGSREERAVRPRNAAIERQWAVIGGW